MTAATPVEAAVQAIAAAFKAGIESGIPLTVEQIARDALYEVVAHEEVRAGLVRAITDAEGWYDPAGARTGEGDPIPGLRVWPLVDAMLGALTPEELT